MTGRLAGVLLVLAAAASLAACSGSEDQGLFDFERMWEQPRYDIYEPSGFFADRTTMRQPPQGTVPRERDPLDLALLAPGAGTVPPATPQPGVRGAAQERLEAPLPVQVDTSRGALATGRRRYDVYCSPCHGVAGFAATPVAGNMRLRKPPSLQMPRIRAMEPTYIARVVTNGYGMMPSYRGQIQASDRLAVAVYVKALQLSRFARLDALPPRVRAEAVKRLGPRPGGKGGEGR